MNTYVAAYSCGGLAYMGCIQYMRSQI